MPPNISIAIINRNDASRNSIEALLKQLGELVKVVGTSADFIEGMRILQLTSPMVVMLEIYDPATGVEEIKHILSRFPRTSVFVTSAQKSSDLILSAMRAGAVEYLLEPIELADLAEALQKVGRLWVAKPAEPAQHGKVISVYNPIGGMGTTTVAVNLAAAIAAGGAKVALVDLNLFSGDVASFLDVNPTYTLSSVTSNISRLDSNFLMSVMTKHASGVYVLTEPLEVDETMDITPEQVLRVLALLKGVFSHVIIDTGGSIAGCNQTTFESSDYILFNTVLSLPALKNAKRYLAALAKKGLRKERVKLVINRYLPRADIQVQDAEKVLDHKVFLTIPNEYKDVIDSINKGMPVVEISPRSPVSKAIERLYDLIKTCG
ncbi:MAG: AAA family ATPase [Geobacteraceae bacterium]|nr:AAA family ATPase [Geobacteraceae bacterium]